MKRGWGRAPSINTNIPFRIILPVLLSSIVVLLFIPGLFLQSFLFIFCLVFMIRFGQFITLDVDPLPLSAFIVFHIQGFFPSLYFIFIALPLIDLLANRLNHFSAINFISLLTTLICFYALPYKDIALLYGILLFNLLRIILGTTLGFGLNVTIFSIIHALIYFITGSILSFFI